MNRLLRSTVLHITAATVVTVMLAAGLIGFGAVGPAGATPTSSVSARQSTPELNFGVKAYGFKSAERQFNCANAERVVTYVPRVESRMAKVRATLYELIAKAEEVKRPSLRAHLVAFWQGTLARRVKHQSHELGPKTLTKLRRLSLIVEDKCHVYAPLLGNSFRAPVAPSHSA
jgi:hypothetical protein